MDVRTALIAGTAFAGVLIAGAVAAPRGGGSDESSSGGTGQPVATNVVQSPAGSFVSLPSGTRYEREHEDDDDDDRDHDDDHEEDDD